VRRNPVITGKRKIMDKGILENKDAGYRMQDTGKNRL
jgi:hypothetical protein